MNLIKTNCWKSSKYYNKDSSETPSLMLCLWREEEDIRSHFEDGASQRHLQSSLSLCFLFHPHRQPILFSTYESSMHFIAWSLQPILRHSEWWLSAYFSGSTMAIHVSCLWLLSVNGRQHFCPISWGRVTLLLFCQVFHFCPDPLLCRTPPPLALFLIFH